MDAEVQQITVNRYLRRAWEIRYRICLCFSLLPFHHPIRVQEAKGEARSSLTGLWRLPERPFKACAKSASRALVADRTLISFHVGTPECLKQSYALALESKLL